MRLATLPRYHLATLPTPLQRARNLEMALGPRCPRIYLKRDDLTGLAFGGNKARKLEYLLADALSNGATTLVTEGAAQSNHARITAAAAAIAGLRSVPFGAAGYVTMVAELLAQLVSAGEAPSRLYFPTGSLGTQAGLVVGARAFSAPFAVCGVAVEHPVDQLIADGVTLANGTAELIGIGRHFTATDITIDGAFIGADYGVPTEEG